MVWIGASIWPASRMGDDMVGSPVAMSRTKMRYRPPPERHRFSMFTPRLFPNTGDSRCHDWLSLCSA